MSVELFFQVQMHISYGTKKMSHGTYITQQKLISPREGKKWLKEDEKKKKNNTKKPDVMPLICACALT